MPKRDQEFYAYRGLIAESWDLLRGDTSNWPDRGFYRDRIGESGEPVLDVGCGTGRLLLDYLADGVDIDGVDNSPEMLVLCRRKAVESGLEPALFEQSMESIDIPRLYRTIIVPSSSFQLIGNRATAGEAIRRFHQHLQPGGALIMPFMTLWTGTLPAEHVPEWRKNAEKERLDGAVVRRWTKVRYDMVRQVVEEEDRYEVVRDGEVERIEHHGPRLVRWYTQQQSLDLYREAGFVDLRVYREFTTEPATADDRIWTVVGRRPA